ncbi:hypothetical protein ALC57_08952 [Trachymyrmex cornetzi]|uniref:Paired domain-containing protein n=1 Tax=Trachymyrmex cornetzi TaxID=471704 RepID=A0A151J672_9HYME|nr:hypothetical protein ALC57_08952 [Trachymyrmex cornetzi]
MAAMLKPSAEYNRRSAIIEGLRAGSSTTEIIRFFGYPRLTVYDIVAKYTASEQSNEDSSMPAREIHSKERTARNPAVVKRAPNSPDLNPLDYYVWSVVEKITNKSRHPNVTSLRTVIEAAFVGMDSATLQRACKRFRQKIEAIIQANGGYIE